MTESQQLPKSKFKYGGKPLHELSHEGLLEAVDAIWDAKNEEIAKLKGERGGLRQLLSSPLPIHSLWRGCVENAMLLGMVALIAFLAGSARQ